MATCVSAWTNREEFEEVYRELYSNDVKKQKHALGRIAVWKSRIPRLPVAIENTAALIGAGLEHQHEIAAGRADWESNHKLRNLYGLALIRFINDITETKQTKFHARSVKSVASELGLPDWLKSSQVLFNAVSITSKNVFGKNKLRIATTPRVTYLKNLFRTMLIEYQQHQFEMLQTTKWMKKKNLKKLLDEMKLVLTGLSSDILSVLLEEGYLVPNVEQLKALHINPEDLISENGLWLPENLVTFWKPLLNILHEIKFTPLLIKRLMDCVCGEELAPLPARLIAGWLMTILFNIHQANQMNEDKHFLYDKRCTVAWQTLIEQAIRVPKKYTLHLVLWMLNEGKGHLMDSQRSHLLELINIYLSQDLIPSSFENCLRENDTRQNENQTSFHTVDEVLQFQSSEKTELPPPVALSWHISTDSINWEKCPLGCVPQEKLSYTSLEFYDENESTAKKRRRMSSTHQNGHTEFYLQTENSDTFEVL
ncbi:LAS1 [Acanthosepion pharaonis]|uniref:LAS1 n=1 Tax=Acanthosepion pharaonis TaxID=158019 RepID=A0A812EST9_ACAPH|nr:LAS1 [Sepia pharaonis]